MLRSPQYDPRKGVTLPNQPRLTPREAEIMSHTAKGMKYEEIAIKLGISRETVKSHIFSVKLRLDAHTLQHAVALSVAHGLITVA